MDEKTLLRLAKAHGTPIVVDASLPVMASSADEAALQRIVDSIAINP